MHNTYFTGLASELARRASLGTVSWLGFANVPLRRHLMTLFEGPYGRQGSFLADPAFEPVFGWQTGSKTMSDLRGDLLHPSLVDAMANPPKELASEYRFPKDRHPYTHQIKAWEILSKEPPSSLVVTSGTGSGKTECFMVPILDALANERERVGGQLTGVRALFLYPLNALINSQRDRLRAWTDGFGGDLRFCLYNGMTPNVLKATELRPYPNEVRDRKTLRANPPPILVTNATMLEYMLVRTQDAPILQASQGKLRWVVLDEAHSYVGSQAAEMALLVRRVLHAFGVSPGEVRFVATSATIGDPEGEAGVQLRRFLAQIAGVAVEQVYLVAGKRNVPVLAPVSAQERRHTLEDLVRLDEGSGKTPKRYAALTEDRTARGLRGLFVRDGIPAVQRLSAVCERLFGPSIAYTREQQDEALAWLDCLSGATDQNGTPFLPLRGHFFHQTLSGIWACSDSRCPERGGTELESAAWPFGQLYLSPRQHCRCGAPVYELISCGDCGELYLDAAEVGGALVPPRAEAAEDEFELEDEQPADLASASEEEATDKLDTSAGWSGGHRLLIANRDVPKSGELLIDRSARTIVEKGSAGAVSLIVHEADDEGLGCPCCGALGEPRRVFRSARIGAPFLLGGILPTLLEYAPDGDKPAELPYRGRRVLTFSDSRQGTARLAARLQQESERAKARGLIYHHALAYAAAGGGPGVAVTEADLVELRRLLGVVPEGLGHKQVQKMIAEKEAERAKQLTPQPIGFPELRKRLAQEGADLDHMVRLYREQSRSLFGGHDAKSILSGILLVREFGRRPKRQNNLETMGLVATNYPKLSQVTQAPPVWTSKGLSLPDWLDFLKLTLDFFVRGGFSLNVDESWRNWLGFRFPRTTIVPALTESLARGQRYWPSARRGRLSSNIVRLLAKALSADMESAVGQDIVDDALRAAWDDLVRAGLLTPSASGYHLQLEDIAFLPIRPAWVCPVTRRFLDTTLKGITPYLPKMASPATSIAAPIELPVYDKPFGGGEDFAARIQHAREWLTANGQIHALREEGLWSTMADRAIELAPFFVTAEHSAQQPAILLDRYERAFKEGRVNLLSCSTTMEMGIDIGGVQVVAMNNTPPHPANYLQRAGRAGRRNETRSAAVTLCKSNPHDQAAFENSRWAFDARLPAPAVSLNSSAIVQRHVNSMVLSQFLRDYLSIEKQDLNKLTTGWFFVAEGEAPAARFVSWADAFEEGGHPTLEKGLAQLVRHSLFEGLPVSLVVRASAAELSKARDRWLAEWRALNQQEANLGNGNPRDPAVKAIWFQKKRLSGEYLLRELATSGFLPAYGFPANIASFDNVTRETADRFRITAEEPGDESKTRDDNRFQRRDLASRDVVSALREYAPGADVVMDGLVYRSAGITLNWHVPASLQDARETQAIQHAWRCRQCGSSGHSYSRESASRCDACGAEIRNDDLDRFLEPAGFAVDFYESPHNDVSSQSFIPVEPPWINSRGEWAALPNPDLGRFRATSAGGVYHRSLGPWRRGYALCLACGRAAPMTADGSLPETFADKREHKKLRSRADDRVCPGSTNRWAIQEGISLGHYGRTDVLEIQLRDVSGMWLASRTIAQTLAVALRDALAELLGVQTVELGCAVKPARTDDGEECQAILIFDHHAAGYASSAPRFIDELFRRAASRLECSQNCDSSCPSCILDFDQRFEAASLDRHVAKRFLTSQWLDQLRLPSTLQYFGEASRVEPLPLYEALLAASGAAGVTRTRLFFSGEPADFDISASAARRLVYRLAGLGRPVEIFIERRAFDRFSEEDRYALASLADLPGLEIRLCAETPKAGVAVVLAEAQANQTTTCWATPDGRAALFSGVWGRSAEPIVAGTVERILAPDSEVMDSRSIRPATVADGDREIAIRRQLNGALQGFGARFWDLLADAHSPTAGLLDKSSEEVVRVIYSDRYLFTPLSIALLVEVVAALRSRVGAGRWETPLVKVSTMNSREQTRPMPATHVYSDWPDLRDRDAVIEAAFDYIGVGAKVEALERQRLSHGRVLRVEFGDGATLNVRLDQGLSYWRVPRMSPGARAVPSHFNFSGPQALGPHRKAAIERQAKDVAELRLPVEGDVHPTEVFLKVRNDRGAQ